MSDRRDVEPAHLLRAVLDDPVAGQVLALCGAPASEVRITLETAWLDRLDGPEEELLHARGVEVAQVLRDLGPTYGGQGDQGDRWQDQRLSPAARDVLVGALREAAKMGVDRVASWHLLVGLVESRDPLVARAFAAHGITARAVRRRTRRLGRRA